MSYYCRVIFCDQINIRSDTRHKHSSNTLRVSPHDSIYILNCYLFIFFYFIVLSYYHLRHNVVHSIFNVNFYSSISFYPEWGRTYHRRRLTDYQTHTTCHLSFSMNFQSYQFKILLTLVLECSVEFYKTSSS